MQNCKKNCKIKMITLLCIWKGGSMNIRTFRNSLSYSYIWKVLRNVSEVIQKMVVFLSNSVNIWKFSIWFSVLKSTHQEASFEIHKSIIFCTNFLFYYNTILHIEKSFWIFFFGFFFTLSIHNFIGPRVSGFIIFNQYPYNFT